MFDHAVGEDPETGYALTLGLEVRVEMHARGGDPGEPGFPGRMVLLDELGGAVEELLVVIRKEAASRKKDDFIVVQSAIEVLGNTRDPEAVKVLMEAIVKETMEDVVTKVVEYGRHLRRMFPPT